MNLKASYFSPSWPLFKENLRRFWAISALSFLVYFFTLAFPILLAYDNLSNLYDYISMSLRNINPVFLLAHGFFPVMVSVLVFRYLHSVSPVTVIHSMPFTRQKLFITNMLSGFFLLAAPILLNGIILLGISKPVFRHIGSETQSAIAIIGRSGMTSNEFSANAPDVFTRGDILTWIGIALVAVFFVYSVSLLAGLVTGNPVMHFTMACLFNFLIPILLSIGITYCDEFLWGFALSDTASSFILSFSPLLKLVETSFIGFLSPLQIIIYITASLVILAITAFIYEKRKLERAGDSLVFHFMEPIICYVITFLGMTAFGFLFAELNINSNGSRRIYLYIGFVAGVLIAFIIGQMIVKKTPRIFNLKSLRDLGIYGIISILFIGSMTLDITGYETRVPTVDNAKFASISSSLFSSNVLSSSVDTIGYNLFQTINFNTPENLKIFQAFNKDIVDSQRLKDYDRYYYSWDNSSSVNISYYFGKNEQYKRSYGLSNDFVLANKNLKQLLESKEFKESIMYKNSPITEINEISLDPNTSLLYSSSKSESGKLKSEENAEFMECVDRDINEMTFEEFVSGTNPYCLLVLKYEYKDPVTGKILSQHQGTIIKRSFKNTIKWIEDHGYGEALAPSAKNIEKIDMHFGETTVGITDPAEIIEILNTYEVSTLETEYILGDVYLKEGYYNENYNYDNYDKYGKYPATVDTMNPEGWFRIHYTEGNVPDFLLKRFKEAKK